MMRQIDNMAKEIPSRRFYLDGSLWEDTLTSLRSELLSPLFLIRSRQTRRSEFDMPHKFWELIVIISGRGSISSNGSEMPFEGGMAFLVPPRTPHREHSEKTVDLLWIGLKGTALKNPMISGLSCIKNESLVEQAKTLWVFSEKGGSNIGPELDGMTLSLMNRYFRNLKAGTVDSGSFMDKAINYFDAHYTEDISVCDVADACGLSKGHFTRIFKKASGKSPIEYLMSVRIRNANRLLENTTLTVREISRLSGYQNEFYFSRAFKKISGMSPSQYRLNYSPPY
ncbi:MAG: AraC family transcriptional regulator [Victivallales bacterium]|jgi:AraC-like DNA-binding protein